MTIPFAMASRARRAIRSGEARPFGYRCCSRRMTMPQFFLRFVTSFVLPLCAIVCAASDASATVTISSDRTKNMNCSGGVCAPTAKNATLNAKDLANMLATSDVKVFTGNNGAVNIQISASFSWVSATTLTLEAYGRVAFLAPVAVAGPGGLTVITNIGGNGGDLNIAKGGSLTFWDLGSSFVVNGDTYTLVGGIASLASDVILNPSGFYALANDYDASQDGTYVHSPIPTPFQGTFRGLGHTIDHLAIDNGSLNDSELGLFSETAPTSLIEDVNLTNLSVQGYYVYRVGGLVAVNRGYISNVAVDGVFSATGLINAGGISQQNYGTIDHSKANVGVGTSQLMEAAGGGIASENYGTITGCQSSGSIIGLEGGGLVDYNQGVVIYSQSSTSIIGHIAGGLVGTNNTGSIAYSFATGAVTLATTGTNKARTLGAPSHKPPGAQLGGLVGIAAGGGAIAFSYATGNVTGVLRGNNNRAGGLVGTNTAQITEAYSIGAMKNERRYTGGLIGFDGSAPESLSASYWDRDTSGVSDPSQGAGNLVYDPGIRGLSTASFKSGLPNRFSSNVWGQSASINNGYPYLLANPPQ